jgi:hypothetical protein
MRDRVACRAGPCALCRDLAVDTLSVESIAMHSRTQERWRTLGMRHDSPCLPRPRKRGTLHGFACVNPNGQLPDDNPFSLLRCCHRFDLPIRRIFPQITVILEIAGRYFGYFPSIISLYHMQREIYARR